MLLKKLFSFEKPTLNQYLFTKNNKKIYFQEMAHISSKEFYKNVNESLLSFLKENKNGKIYLEGVYGENEEYKVLLNNKLQDIFGVEDKETYGKDMVLNSNFILRKLYIAISFLTDLKCQSKMNYLKNINQKDTVQADMTHKELLLELNNMNVAEKNEKIAFPTNKFWIKLKKLKIFKYIIRKVLKASILSTNALVEQQCGQQERVDVKSDNNSKSIMHIILNKRNEKLIKIIEDRQEDNIFITYGAAHFHGVKDILLKNSYSVEIIKRLELGF